LTTDIVGFKAGDCPCAPLYPCTPFTILSLTPSLRLEKERGMKRGESKKKRNRKEYYDLEGVALPP
jgi:hypothetical protein